MKNKKLQIATVFSGIGAFEQSLNKLKIPYDIVFAVIMTLGILSRLLSLNALFYLFVLLFHSLLSSSAYIV